MADRLETDLAEIGRRIRVPEVDLAPAVLARLATEPLPVRPPAWRRRISTAGQWIRRRWRGLLAVLLGGTLIVGVATPAGAAVLRWLRIGAVEVRQEAPPTTAVPTTMTGISAASSILPGPPASLPDAAGVLGFQPLVPRALGQPDLVEISTDHRVLTLSWRNGLVLTEFAGSPDPLFIKTQVDHMQYVTRGDVAGYWFPGHHTLVYRDAAGIEHTESARLSAQTLVWTSGDLTLRLEGDLTVDRALEIAVTVG